MEVLDRLTAWLRRNVWCFIVGLILTIFWMAAFMYAGQGAAIATWLSIFFTVIVIVYMLIQGQQMKNLTEDSYRRIEQKTNQIEKIINQAGRIPGEPTQSVNKVSELSKAVVGPEFTLDTTNCLWIVLLTFYAVAKSAEKAQKSSAPYSLDMRKISSIIQGYHDGLSIQEHIMALSIIIGIALGLGCILGPGSIISEPRGILIINKVPSSFVDYMLKATQERIDDLGMSPEHKARLTYLRDKIDDYFITS